MEQESDPKKVLSHFSFRIVLGIVVMAVIGGSLVATYTPCNGRTARDYQRNDRMGDECIYFLCAYLHTLPRCPC